MRLDPWQGEVLKTEGNIVLRSGRQVGKSTIIALKAAQYALKNPGKIVMVIAKVERQAQLLFTKILLNIHSIDKRMIRKGRDQKTKQLMSPTKTRINLTNGSTIHCLPAGETGYGLMGYTIDLLIADEAAFIPEEVYLAIIPAMAITRGNIWLLSTPFVKEGYYYDCFEDETFTSFHQSAEDCPRKDQAFLDRKKATLTKTEYSMWYQGKFVDEVRQFFSDKLIKDSCTLSGSNTAHPVSSPLLSSRDYFLGVDIARMGEDESTFQVIDRTKREHLIHTESIITTKTLTTDTTRKILELNKQYDFKKIYIDTGGMGVGVFDQLLEDESTRRKVVSIDNASRALDRDETRKKKLLKEDLYVNLRRLMERGAIKLLKDDEVMVSLKSIQAEYNKTTGRMKISGSYSHITEGIIRACWCVKDKSLNIYYF